MKRNYEESEVRRKMYEELNSLMEEGRRIILEDNNNLYNLQTHCYLTENAWEIMFPLKKESWPNKFNEFLADDNLPWPQGSTYSYAMSIICPPFINFNSLYFGYAVIAGKLIRTTFFAINIIVEYQVLPQSMVIDPLCLAHKIEPEYYIGCCVEKKDIEKFIFVKKNPLEVFVERKKEQEHKERLYDTYIEAYNLQIYFEPGYFPPQLIKFCEENGLYVPPQKR